MKTSQIISVYNSKTISEKLVPSFATIKIGDVLSITDNVFVEQTPYGNYEMLIFTNTYGKRVKLSLSQILKSDGTVGASLQSAIWNRDIECGKHVIEVLKDRVCFRVSDIEYVNVPMPSGHVHRKPIYTFDWV